MQTEEQRAQRREYNRRYREKNRERIAEQQREWRKENPGYGREYAERNREKRNGYNRRYHAKNRDEINENTRAWRKENPGYGREYYAANRERIAERTRDYYRRNADAIKARNSAYGARPESKKKARARRLAAKYGMSLEAYTALADAQQWLCAACRGEPNALGLVVDHDHATGRVRGLLCSKCNSALGLLDDALVRVNGLARYLRADAKRQ